MTNGSFGSDTLFAPRMRMRAPPPTVPVDGRMFTPAARPDSKSVMLVIGWFSTMSDGRIVLTALPFSRARDSPLVVTSTASSDSATRFTVKSAVRLSPGPTVTRCVSPAYPMMATRTSYVPGATPAMTYLPCWLVTAPLFVAPNNTRAGDTGLPAWSTTVPVIVPFCAFAARAMPTNSAPSARNACNV